MVDDNNLRRRFVNQNKSRIVCEPSGKRLSELTREWNLMKNLLRLR